MALEIEHKFLVRGDGWRVQADGGRVMRQGYLAYRDGVSIRVRTIGEQAWLGIKQARSLTVRDEYEYLIPMDDALALLSTACDASLVDKTRYLVEHGRHTWEVDVFHGDNDGLVVAEVELRHEGEAFERPSWLGDDVSEDPRFLNHNLSRVPYARWPAASGGDPGG